MWEAKEEEVRKEHEKEQKVAEYSGLMESGIAAEKQEDPEGEGGEEKDEL